MKLEGLYHIKSRFFFSPNQLQKVKDRCGKGNKKLLLLTHEYSFEIILHKSADPKKEEPRKENGKKGKKSSAPYHRFKIKEVSEIFKKGF